MITSIYQEATVLQLCCSLICFIMERLGTSESKDNIFTYVLASP